VKVAALYDVHGNLPALEAVLADVSHEGFEQVVVGGDVTWGPWPAQTLARLRALDAEVRFVRGNCDREVLALDPDSEYAETNAWVAERLDGDAAELVAAWPFTVELAIEGLGQVCFCHATPRSDDERITVRTPGAALAAALGGTTADVVVVGHTHVQFDLAVGRQRLVNAGSVGFGYEGEPGAYWLELGPGVRHRRSAYDFEAAAAAMTGVGWPGPWSAGDILAPARRDDAIAAFEAERVGEAAS
jgi:putative phosphoesterase